MKSPRISRLFAFSASLLVIAAAASGETSFQSPPTKVRLIELYTSEGCSSCPPAEAWLSKLKSDPRLWRDFAPLAFHVDYWDRLGWRDPYASPQWTARQYAYSAAWNSSSVYTPGFCLDGREWQRGGVPSAANENPGVLKISINGNESIAAEFQPSGKKSALLDVHVARLGFGLVTNVRAGENSGRKLEHDFVVLSLNSAKMQDGGARLRSAAASQSSGRSAVVAWITHPGSLEPIQAVGGWLQ